MTADTISDLYRRARSIREELDALPPDHAERELLREAAARALDLESVLLVARERAAGVLTGAAVRRSEGRGAE